MKPNIVFFSRSYQNKLFPLLISEKYDSVHVTLTTEEKKYLVSLGLEVKYCFEEFKEISYNGNIDDYLISSFVSDRFLNRHHLEYRRDFLKKEICFWSRIFDEYKPIAVVNELVAIEIAEVMYIEAKKRNIRYLAWMNNPVNSYFYWISDPMSLSLDNKILSLIPSNESIRIAREYLSTIIEKYEKPYYIIPFLNRKKSQDLVSSIKGLIKLSINKLKTKSSFYEDNTYAILNYFERSFKAYYKNYDKLEDLNGNEVVMYPLHYEPEASLSYLSEFYSNQVSLIENLTKCLNTNQLLVIKEHPAQSRMLLTRKYQRLKRENSQLVFLPSEISSYEIIIKSDLIVTLTSHLGWEAIIFGKPVYLLGKMFYDKYPHINRFKTFEKLREDIRKKKYIYPNEEETIKYIARLIEVSYKGKPFPCSSLYEPENIDSIRYAIEKELQLLD